MPDPEETEREALEQAIAKALLSTSPAVDVGAIATFVSLSGFRRPSESEIRRDQAEKDAVIAQRRIDVGYAGHPIITAEFPDNGQQIASAIRAQFTPSPETSENGDN